MTATLDPSDTFTGTMTFALYDDQGVSAKQVQYNVSLSSFVAGTPTTIALTKGINTGFDGVLAYMTVKVNMPTNGQVFN